MQQHAIFECDEFEPQWHKNKLTKKTIKKFQQLILEYYTQYGREFTWRQTQNPYHIVVSEIMLQQTQTFRVVEKYKNFIEIFPHFYALAHAAQKEVFSLWQGLGYNRRAFSLQKIAQIIVDNFDGNVPNDPAILKTFPSIGPATAASICAFAFNKPTFFIETNIRSVFIHFFFKWQHDVCDDEIMPLVQSTLDRKEPRLWYYALMDYGVMLKKKYKNPSIRSIHYTRQSKFEGSDRQIRGAILKILLENEKLTYDELSGLIYQYLHSSEERVSKIANILLSEGLIKNLNGYYFL